jgi:hypothetical protein
VRAFVAVAGVLQNGKWVLCNFVIEISECFWQFLIVCCGCSPCSDLQLNVVFRYTSTVKGKIMETTIQLVSVFDNLGKIWCRFLRIMRRSGVAFLKKATPILLQIYSGGAVFGLKTVGTSSDLQ